jgi:hypothetical protein
MKRVFLEVFRRVHNPEVRKWARLVWNGQVWACRFDLGLFILDRMGVWYPSICL